LTVLHALILGVVQGFTEFLPVSSSGHLVLVPEFFNIPAPTLAFDILVHVATLVAVVGYFIRDIGKMVVSVVVPGRMSREEVSSWRRLLLWLVIGSVPAGFAGFLLSDFFEGLFSSTLSVGVFLVVTSLLLWGADLALGRVNRRPAQLDKMRAVDALVVGCFQALAIAPGLSRSGSTIAAGVFLGFDRPTAARFSFLLSIPAILGAFLFKLNDIGGAFAGASGLAYALGAVAAAISGFAAVYFVMRYLKEHRLRLFAVYTVLLGVFVIVLSVV
jgi:undecaprenyl-diphosphatase